VTRPGRQAKQRSEPGTEGTRHPRRVVLVVAPGAEVLDLVGPFQVFTTASELFRRQHPSAATIYRVEVIATSQQTSFVTNSGLQMRAHGNIQHVRGGIDTLLVAGGSAVEEDCIGQRAVQWIRDVAGRTRRVGSVCTGAFLLARAGLLDGRRATTHWNWCARLARRYPRVAVESDPIFIRDGNVYTSAGVTAGMDLALALIEEDHGPQLALQVARQLVLYLRRPGGQSQFSAALSMQLSDREPLRELQSWMLENLRASLDVQTLARRVAMSPRNFARVFRRETRVTPRKYVERLRVETARRRLEESRQSLKRIADECGFGTVSAMRTVFQKLIGVPPGQYRQHFQGTRLKPRVTVQQGVAPAHR
jgi:transcriptional regulator GlxA family with amidase domain